MMGHAGGRGMAGLAGGGCRLLRLDLWTWILALSHALSQVP
jgi:hypothetical protein